MDQNELYHHGIKGQKWGVRRYQNPDGSLTAVGKKKYGTKSNYEKVLKAKSLKAKVKAQKEREKQNARTEAEVAKYKRRAGIKEEKDATSDKPKTANDKPHVKTLSEMTNEEIQERIDRINLENRLKALTPHQKTRGEKIIDGIKDMTMDTIKKKVVPDLTDIAVKKLKEKLGIKDNSSELERLADAAKRAGYEKQIAEAEITKRKNDREKGQNNQHDQNQNNDRNEESNNSDGNNTRNEESNNSDGNANRQNDTETFRDVEVEGTGTSTRNPYESRSHTSSNRTYYDEPIDVDGVEIVDDDHRIEQQNSGPPAISRRRRLRHSEIGEELVDGLLKDDELCHYGVVGMKWGVRRGVKELNRAYSDGGVYRGQHNHAVSKLSGHRDKINKKISKLEKKRVSIDNAIYKNETKIAPKVAKLHQKASKLTVKADRTSNYDRYEKLHRKANILEYKVSKLESTAAKAKAKLAKNQKIQEEFKKGLSTIQKEMIDKGRDFLYMRSNGIPYTNGDIDEWTPLKKVKE